MSQQKIYFVHILYKYYFSYSIVQIDGKVQT
jgi:hypothetical protein